MCSQTKGFYLSNEARDADEFGGAVRQLAELTEVSLVRSRQVLRLTWKASRQVLRLTWKASRQVLRLTWKVGRGN